MKCYVVGIAAIGIAVGLFGAAHGADVAAPVYRKTPVVYQPADLDRWTGFYVGAGAGAGWLGSSVYTDQNRARPAGRITAGYDRQFGTSFVGGVFGDLQYSGARAGVAPNLTYAYGVTGLARNEWGGDLGARVGWLATSRVLFYGEGGVSLTALRESLNDPVAGATWSLSRSSFGWFAGAGAEMFVAKHVTLRTEYRYGEIDAGSKSPVRTLRDQTALFGVTWRP